jgi:hypothetical protein
MSYLGDFDLGTTLYTKFTTVNASGVPTELSAPAVAFFSNANTTAFSSGGISCDASWNSTNGLNHVQMILTTSATGMTTGSSYQIALTTGTVSGVNLKGYVVAEFSIRKRSALMPTTAGQQVVIDSSGQVQANVTAASTNIGAVVTASSINIGAIVTTCNTVVPAKVTSMSASGLASMFLTDSTTNFAAAVSGSPVHEIGTNATIVSVSTVVPANVTAASTNIGAVVTASSINIGAIVTAANTNIGAIVTAVSTIVPARVTAQGIDVGAIVTAFNTIAPANVTAYSTAIAANVTSASTMVPANVTAFSASGIGMLYTVSPLITYASATATSLVRALVTGVWDEPGANHTTIGSLGQELNSAGAAADPWATVLPGAYVTAQAGNIIGSRVDVSVGSRLATGATVASVSVLGTVAGVSVIQTVSSNIVQVASVSVTGFGTVGSPWGP